MSRFLRPALALHVLLTWMLHACSDGESPARGSQTDAGGGCGTQQASGACPTPNDGGADAAAPSAVRFRKLTLHREFFCEGAAYGDIDGDGATDVIAGPHWYAGPSFSARSEIWQAQPADVYRYSECFLEWTHDFNRDGALDLLVVGFPGETAAWFENPGSGAQAWTRHEVVAAVDNESPAFVDLTGDGEPELVFAQGGRLGFAGPGADPTLPWVFHALSDARDFAAFSHGLGAADVDGDGRLDVLEASAWWRQPADLAGDPLWTRMPQSFGGGGAQMAATDVDGDGDSDVITTLAAHGYGLAIYEQVRAGSTIAFEEQIIVPNVAPPPDAEVVLHEPHALALADIDADGLTDVITGERFWGHVPMGDPDFGDPARVYWFRLERAAGVARFWPHLIDADSGVGTQISAGDVDGDGRVDIVSANKKGAFVFLQQP